MPHETNDGGQAFPQLNSTGMTSHLLTNFEASEVLSITSHQVSRLARRGELPYVLLPNNEVRFDLDDIREWVGSCKRPEKEVTPAKLSITGMTLRDWFAGQALSSTYPLTASIPLSDVKEATGEIEIEAATGAYAELIAEAAYTIADAMIEARKG